MQSAPRGDDVELSVVIAARNAADTLGAQLGALSAQSWTGRWDVVVVDNGSDDATADIVGESARGWPALRLVTAREGTGAAYARNTGVRSCRGRSIAFCDADDVVGPSWVAAMGDALRCHDFVSGPIDIDSMNPPWLVESRSRRFFGNRTVFDGVFPFASSCNMGVGRACFERIGGFDEQYLVGQDLELSLRMWLAGVELHFAPGALVRYRFRRDMGALYRRSRSYGQVRPLIAERLRRTGLPAPSRWSGARNWVWLLRHLADLRTKGGRAYWLTVAGYRVGNLRGSRLVHRLYL